MSNKSEWNDAEVILPTEEEIKAITPNMKQLFNDSLKTLIREETRRCTCECHYSSRVMHMSPCCDQTYVQH